MLSVIIPVLDPDQRFIAVLDAVDRELSGLGADIIISSAGMSPDIAAICAERGVTVIDAPKGRGQQLALGAASARQPWLLFLHADTILMPGSVSLLAVFLMDPVNEDRAGWFRLAFDDDSAGAQRVARLANWRSRRLGLPYGDQSLFLSRALYDSVGGYEHLPLMEDVDLVRRLGRHRLVELNGDVETSAERYRDGGYWLRPMRNLFCLGLYLCGAPMAWIERIYRGRA